MAVMVILRRDGAEQEVRKRDLLDWLNDLADDNIERGLLHGRSDAEVEEYDAEYKAYRRALCAYIRDTSADGAPCVLDIDETTDMLIVPDFSWRK